MCLTSVFEATDKHPETPKIIHNLIEARTVYTQVMPNRLDEAEPCPDMSNANTIPQDVQKQREIHKFTLFKIRIWMFIDGIVAPFRLGRLVVDSKERNVTLWWI